LGGETSAQPCATEIASLCGVWLFRIDPDNLGTKKSWYGTEQSEAPIHVQIDVLHPTSFSAYTLDWKP